MSHSFQRFHDSTNAAPLYRGHGLEHPDGGLQVVPTPLWWRSLASRSSRLSIPRTFTTLTIAPIPGSEVELWDKDRASHLEVINR